MIDYTAPGPRTQVPVSEITRLEAENAFMRAMLEAYEDMAAKVREPGVMRRRIEQLHAKRQAGAAEADEPPTPSRPRIVVKPRASPNPHHTWAAYSPERPGLGRFYAGTPEEALSKGLVALRALEEEDAWL